MKNCVTIKLFVLTFLVVVLCGLIGTHTYGQVPNKISSQGLLTATVTVRSNAELEIVRDLTSSPEPVLIGENQYSVTVRPQDVNILRQRGIHLSNISGSSARQIQQTATSSRMVTSPNLYVQEMADAVSGDSLATIIQGLEGFGTRYEYTPTQDAAATYLYQQFQRWGYSVAYDQFGIGISTAYDADYVTANVGWVCGTNGLLAYTTNGGSNWTNQSSGFGNSFYGMDFVSSSTGWAVSDGGVIVKTTDGGITWSLQTSPVTSTLYDVSFINDLDGLIVGVSGVVLRTTDGGGTWTSISSGTTNTLRKVSFVDLSHAWAVGGMPSSAGTILYSSDGGWNWSDQSNLSFTNYFRGLCFVDVLNGWVTGDGSTILKTTDGGVNWIAKTPPPGTGTILRGASFIDLLEGWTVDYYGHKLLHTTDGGESWSVQYAIGTSYPVDVCAFSLERITVLGSSSTVITSTDGGASWTSQSSNLPSQFFHNTQNVVATLPGTMTPENECVIVGHYDSYSNDPYVSAPGANDNATGSAAVMEAARLCRGYQFESTIKFLVVAAEEVGLLGSTHYATQAQTEGRNIIGVVNGDMLGYPSTGDPARIVTVGYLTYNRLLDSVVEYNSRYSLGLNLVTATNTSRGSDHVPFTDAGYDAIEVAEATAEEIWGGSDPYYHSTSDIFGNLNMVMVRNGARLMLTTVAELAQPVTRIASEISVTPTSFTETLPYGGGTVTRTMTINNTGLGDLDFTVNINELSAMVGKVKNILGLNSFDKQIQKGKDKIGFYADTTRPASTVQIPHISLSKNNKTKSILGIGDVLGTYSGFPSNNTGMAWVDNDLYAVDYGNAMFHHYDINTQQVVASHNIHSYPYGIVWDGQYLWIGSGNGNIYGYDLNGNLVGSFSAPFVDFTALTWDGEYFIVNVAFINDPVFYRVDYTGTIVESFTSYSGYAFQTAWVPQHQNGHLWATDPYNDQIVQLALDAGVVTIVQSFSFYDNNSS